MQWCWNLVPLLTRGLQRSMGQGQSCQVEHVKFLESWSTLIITWWRHWTGPIRQVAPSSGLPNTRYRQTSSRRNRCSVATRCTFQVPVITISRIQTKIVSHSHQKHVFCRKIWDQSNSLNSVRCCDISVRPGDRAPFLETHGSSVRLGRSAGG